MREFFNREIEPNVTEWEGIFINMNNYIDI